MPQVARKTSQAVNAVQGSKRQTYNSTKGEVLLVCDEDVLSESQQLVYSEHEEKMKGYRQAADAYTKAYGKLDAASGPAEDTSKKAATASLSCEGNSVVQNGVVATQLKVQQKPQQLQPQPQQKQLQHLQKPIQQQLQLQQNVSVPITTPAKKATVVTSVPWRPQVVANLVNKTVMPPTIPVASNTVANQQLVPRFVNTVNPTAQRTVIQVPVGTDLTNMQVVNLAGSTGNYQLVLQPQVAYSSLNTNSVVSQSTVPIGSSVISRPAPAQNILLPITASTATRPVTSQTRVVSAGNASAVTVASIQAVSVGTTIRSSNKGLVYSQAGSNKRTALEDGDKRKSKRVKLGPSNPDVVENYYGWKQGRLWWDDDKPRGSFRCYVCNKKLPTNIRYMQHVRHHLEKEQQQNSIKNNTSCCCICFKRYKTSSALRLHTEKYHEHREHRCGICEEPFDDSQSLLNHLSRNHRSLQMPYVCGVCNYASSICDDLILHFNKHHEGSKALMCPFCVRVVRCNNSFLRHCKTHLSVNIQKGYYHCEACKLMFLNNSMLKEHLQEDHKIHSLQDRNGVPTLPAPLEGKPAEAVPVQKVSFPKQTSIKVSPSLWSRREIIKPRGRLRCLECGTITDDCKEHFRQKMTCTRCKYSTHCGTAFANHMIVFHKAGSAPKLHRIRKTVVNNGRILLGCRNCEFSTLSPTLMTCHIESCPRGSLVIESFKVRTQSLQSSRHYKREVIPVSMKTSKPVLDDGEDDDVVVIEEDIKEEILVDLTDDAPSTSNESNQNDTKPTSEESKERAKNVSLTVKLEKLPSDLNLNKLVSDINRGGNDKDACKEKSTEVDCQEQSTINDEEPMEIDKPANGDNSSDNAMQKAPNEDDVNKAADTGEPAVGVKEKGLQETSATSDEASMNKNETSKDKDTVNKDEASGNKDEASGNQDKAALDKNDAAVDKVDAAVDKVDAAVDKVDAAVDKVDAAVDKVDAAVDPGAADKDPGAADKDPGAADKDPGAADKDKGSADKDPGAADKDPGAADKDPGAADKDPGAADKDPGAADKDPGAADKDPGAADKDKGSADKDPGAADKDPGAADKDPGAADKDPGAADKDPGAADKDPGAADKDPGAADKDPGSEDSGKVNQTRELRIKQEQIDL